MTWTYRAVSRLVLLASILLLAPAVPRLAWGRPGADCALRIGSGALDSPFIQAAIPVTLDSSDGLVQAFRIAIAFDPEIATAVAIEPAEGVLALNPQSILPEIVPGRGLLTLSVVIDASIGPARRGIPPGSGIPIANLRLRSNVQPDSRGVIKSPLRWADRQGSSVSLTVSGILKPAEAIDLADGLLTLAPNPNPGFRADRVSGPAPLVVEFTPEDEILDPDLPRWRRWDFGDGATDTAPGRLVHVYREPGRYTAALAITTAAGPITSMLAITVDPSPVPAALFRRGDVNRDQTADISDAVNILGALFLGTFQITCEDAADVNDSGDLDISDPIALLGFLFLGDPAPPAPGPFLEGLDPTPDILTCGDAGPPPGSKPYPPLQRFSQVYSGPAVAAAPMLRPGVRTRVRPGIGDQGTAFPGAGTHLGIALEGSSTPEDPQDGAPFPEAGVDLATCSLVYGRKVLEVRGRGLDYCHRILYRSASEADTPQGSGWTHTYFTYLTPLPGGDFHLSMGDQHRGEVFRSNADGTFTPPPGLFARLHAIPDGHVLLDRAGKARRFDAGGRLAEVRDADGNSLLFFYEDGARPYLLTRVNDTMGRDIHYDYFPGAHPVVVLRSRLREIRDFTDRRVIFEYDAEGNLTGVRSPVVTGTPNGNDFPDGKWHRYEYSSGALPRPLAHNLIRVIRPNENDPGPFGGSVPDGTPALKFDYDAADRLTAYTAGTGTLRIDCEDVPLEPATPTRNSSCSRVRMTDRKGNVTLYSPNAHGAITSRSESTIGIHAPDPPAFVTEWKFNSSNLLERLTLPAGNAVVLEYDAASSDPRARANVLAITRLPDRARGGDQEMLRTLLVHEPIFNRPLAVVDPRGSDPLFIPPNGGAASPARYAEKFSYDYQESASAKDLSEKVFLSGAAVTALIGEVSARLAALGLSAKVLDLGDLDGDGAAALRTGGRLVRREPPAVTLIPLQSRQRAIEGGAVQKAASEYRYNAFGQITASVDPEGNTDIFIYYRGADPNGDGDGSEVTRPGAGAASGGYLAAVLRDASFPPALPPALAGLEADPGPGSIRRREAAGPVNSLRLFERDARGNVLRETDPRGNSFRRVVNALDQAVVEIGPAPFDITQERFFSANDQVIQSNFEDRVPVASGRRPDIPPGPVAAAVNEVDPDADLNFTTARTAADNRALPTPGRVLPGFFRSTMEHDILDQPTLSRADAIGSAVPVEEVRFRYDRNGNLIQGELPRGNKLNARYDERDLIYLVGIGGAGLSGGPDADGTTYGDDAFDVQGGVSTFAQWYDLNGNAVIFHDGEDNDGDGQVEESRTVVDGFDREAASIDAAGNVSLTRYDPISEPAGWVRFGPAGGPTPRQPDFAALEAEVRRLACPGVPTSGATILGGMPALAASRYHRDERGRLFQMDQELFRAPPPPGVERRAAPSAEGPLLRDRAFNRLWEHDRNSRATFLTDDHGQTTALEHDGLGRRVSSQDPAGNRLRFSFDSLGNRTKTVSQEIAGERAGGGIAILPETFVETKEYDSLGRVTRIIDNVGNAAIFAYDSRGNLTNRVDPEGSAMTTFYDGLSRPMAEVLDLRDGPAGPLTAEGTRAAVALENLDKLGLVPHQDITDTGISTQWSWNPNGRIDKRTDDNGNAARFFYDSHDRIIEARGHDGRSNTYAYDRDDHITAAADRNATGYTFGYDNIQRVLTYTVAPAPSIPADNANSNPLLPAPSKTQSMQVRTTGSKIIQYEYDGLGRVTFAFDENDPSTFTDNSVTRRDYDSLSRLIQEDQTFGEPASAVTRSVRTSYDGPHRVAGLVYPDGRELVFTYNSLGFIDSIADAPSAGGRLIAAYERIGPARLLRRFHGNGTAVDMQDGTGTGYDAAGRPLRVRHTGLTGAGSGAFGFEYGYDADSHPVFERKLHAPGLGELLENDSSHRVTRFRRGTLAPVAHAGGIVRGGPPRPTGQDFAAAPSMASPAAVGLGIQEWSLDGLGNWTETRTAERTFDLSAGVATVLGANDQNEITVIGETGSSPSVVKEAVPHDPAGNRIQDGRFDYRYDFRNRLREVHRRSDGSLIARYLYDAFDRRIRKEVSNSGPLDGVTHYYYDGERVIEERNGTGGLLRQYVFGQRLDEPLALDRNTGGGPTAVGPGDERYFYHQDLRRSVCGLSDASGKLVEGHVYDPYGEVTTFLAGPNGLLDFGGDDAVAGAPGARDNRWLFTGQYLDAETGLYYFRARFYDPDLGRFINRDIEQPGASMNLYEYAGSNPFAGVDPSGHITATVFEEYGVRRVWDMEIDGQDGPFWGVIWYSPTPGQYGNEVTVFSATAQPDPAAGGFRMQSEATYLPVLIEYVEKYPAPETVHHEHRHKEILEDVATNLFPNIDVPFDFNQPQTAWPFDPTTDPNTIYWSSRDHLLGLNAPFQDAFHAGEAKRNPLMMKWIARDLLHVLRYGWRDPKWAAIRLGSIIYRVAQKAWNAVKKVFGPRMRPGAPMALLLLVLLAALHERRRRRAAMGISASGSGIAALPHRFLERHQP